MKVLIYLIFLNCVLITFVLGQFLKSGKTKTLNHNEAIKFRSHDKAPKKNYDAKKGGKLIWKFKGKKYNTATNGYTMTMECDKPFNVGKKSGNKCSDHVFVTDTANGKKTVCGSISKKQTFNLNPSKTTTAQLQYNKQKKAYKGFVCTVKYKAKPVNGKFSQWGQWSPCTQLCGPNTRSRSRTCTPPAFGGRDCSGQTSQTTENTCTNYPCDQISIVPNYMDNYLENVGQVNQKLTINLEPLIPVDPTETFEWTKVSDGSVVSSTNELIFSDADIADADTGLYKITATKYGITEEMTFQVFQSTFMIFGGDASNDGSVKATMETFRLKSKDSLDSTCTNSPSSTDYDEMKVVQDPSNGDIVGCASRGDANEGQDCYKLHNSLWTTYQNVLTSNRFEGKTVSLDGSLAWFAGGPTMTDSTSEILDMSTMTSSSGPTMFGVNSWCMAKINSSHTFVSGGLDSNNDGTNNAKMYDWDNSNWIDLDPMLYKRADHACGFIDDRIVVAGGYSSDEGYLYTTEVFTRSTQQWTKEGDILDDFSQPLVTVGAIMVEYDGKLHMLGGGYLGTYIDYNMIHVFDTSDNTWDLKSEMDMAMATPRRSPSAVYIKQGFIMKCD